MVPLAQAARDAGDEVLWGTSERSCHLLEAAGLDVAAAGLGVAGFEMLTADYGRASRA